MNFNGLVACGIVYFILCIVIIVQIIRHDTWRSWFEVMGMIFLGQYLAVRFLGNSANPHISELESYLLPACVTLLLLIYQVLIGFVIKYFIGMWRAR